MLLFSCNQPVKEVQAKPADQITVSEEIKKLVDDTAKVNPYIDSLRIQFDQSYSRTQIELLGDLSENWRPHSFAFAIEELAQARQQNYLMGQGDAMCKLGIYYCRKFNPDSALYFLDSALTFAKTYKIPVVEAQAISWKAEIHRQQGELEKCIDLQNKAIAISSPPAEKKRLSFCFLSKAEAYRIEGLFDSAMACYARVIDYASAINDMNRVTIAYNGLGEIFRVQNNYPKSLEYYNKGMELSQQNNNKQQMAFCLSSMGDIYNAQKDFEKALSFYEQAYKIAEENGFKNQQCNSLAGIGMTYFLMNEKQQALDALGKTVELANETGNVNKLAFAYTTLANTYQSMNESAKALEYYNKSVEIAQQTNNYAGLANSYNQLGEYLEKLGQLDEAESNTLKAFDLSRKLQIPEEVKKAARCLSLVYERKGKHQQSLKMLRLFIAMRDSIGNEENIKKLAAVEFQAKEQGLKAEQKAREETYKAQQAQKEEELKRQKTIGYAFTVGFLLVLILVVVIYKNLRLNQKKNKIITAQKKEVEHQKELVDEKNKEITDSINYAKRLQEAILPPIKLVKQVLPESFVLYLPKDIVAGDFYWMETVSLKFEAQSVKGEQTQNQILNTELVLIAAADSTGHGVPGAMVSVVCSNALNRAVKEFQLRDPGKILDKTRELVLETFEKSEGDVKDGMDVSLLGIDRKAGKICWAGANNPLWYIRNGNVEEIKATKQPIGKTDNPVPFTTHEIPYNTGDIFYLITDGYADQFGGPKGKKFKYKQLEDVLKENCLKPMEAQKTILEAAFNDWKQEKEQVDDVTIIGIKM